MNDIWMPSELSLLDYFAGQVLTAVGGASGLSSRYSDVVIARHCYSLATAMIAEKHRLEKNEKGSD